METDLFGYTISNDQRSWFSDFVRNHEIGEIGGWPDIFGDTVRELCAMPTKNNIRTLSLFSGGGGLDIGFHDAGFQLVECNELEPKFAKTLEANSQPGRRLEGAGVVCADIRSYEPGVRDIDFIIGGPPCQTFSAAGARAAGVNGTDDDRGNLFLEYARILDQLKPKGFLFENVYRIVGAQQGKAWQSIQDAFRSLGYTLYWRILDTADYGVPQFRERLFIVGLRDGHFQFPMPTHGPDSPGDRPYYSAGKAVSDLEQRVPITKIGGRHGHLLDGIPPGLNYSFYTERMGHPNPIFGWRTKFSDYLYKADPATPVRTIKAQGGQYTGPFSWENRPFSIPEYKRLQTFPDDYELIGNRQDAIHQIGNSVPPQIGRILALSIRQQVFGKPPKLGIEVIPDSLKLGFRKRKARLTHVYAEKARKAISKIAIKAPEAFTQKTGEFNFTINNRLKLVPHDDDSLPENTAEYVLGNKKWEISLLPKQRKRKTPAYSVEVTTNGVASAFGGAGSVVIKSFGSSERSVLDTWKVFEYLIQKYTPKDDLIQIFGYYQWRKDSSFQINLYEAKLKRKALWRVLGHLTKGLGVGKVQSANEFAFLYGESPEDIVGSFIQLKSIGYEIRSHTTNKQIPKGCYLIPYGFPTLNERSLQRSTTL